MRTPILFSLPGTIAPADYPTLVSSIDIAPTILAAAGISKPAVDAGGELCSQVTGRSRITSTRTARSFGEIFAHNVADIDDPAASLEYRWCVDRQLEADPAGQAAQDAELYDVLADPFERHNQARSQPQIVRALTEKIDAWWPRRRALQPRS